MYQMFRPQAESFVCTACDEAMQLTAVIPPLGRSVGMRLYVCPSCDRSRDVLIPAHAMSTHSGV
jgi:hypothetical protein